MVRHLGKYQIIRSLGQGAMGEVYLAHHPIIGREVAIKTILPSAAKGEDAEGRFRREAEAAGQLSHPNLVTIFDFDKDGEVLFLVMEFVKGDDLEDLIRQQVLSPSQFLEVLAQVCDGLSHAHRNGIIHRDVKPANVRVIRDGRNLQAKVMDFGIARVADSSLTATGIVMGTVSYMAPEYIRHGRASAQSDLFAVGVMLYECLTGRKPFPGDNTTTILFKIVSDTPAPIEVGDMRGISPSVRQVLDKALAKEPAERFQTADDLAKALRACKDPSWAGTLDEATAMLERHQAQEPARAATEMLPKASDPVAAPALTPVPAPVPAPPPTPQAASRTGLYAVAGVAVLALAAGGAYVALRPGAAAPAPAPAASTAAPGSQPVPGSQPAPGSQSASGSQPAPAPRAASPTMAQPAPQPASAPAPLPAPVRETTHAGPAVPAKAEAPKPEPPKPAEDPTARLAALIATDPRQAAVQWKALAQAEPRNPVAQGNYLAALYRSRNAWDFERALSRAQGNGVTVAALLKVPAFNAAMAEERRLAKAGAEVLPKEVMDKVYAGL